MFHRSPDKVALTGAIVALAAIVALPLVRVRPNRLAAGDPIGWSQAGGLAIAAAIVAVAVIGVSVFVGERRRGPMLSAAAVMLMWGTAFAIGAEAVAFRSTAGEVARTSVGSGSWSVLVGAAIVGFAGWQATELSSDRRSLARLIGVLPPVAGLAGIVAAGMFGGLDEVSLAREYGVRASVFWPNALAHLRLVGTGLAVGVVVGVPLGVWASRDPHVRRMALGTTGVIQTIPSLAMLGLLIAPLAAVSTAIPWLRQIGVRGIGDTPALIALSLYALLPIVRNTFVGLVQVDRGAIDAGRGMGMSRGQLLRRVELPLALPLVFEGVRASAVLLVGITAVTALVGSRNLGSFIFEGLGQAAPDLILLGALPIIVLAVAVDLALTGVSALAVPKGVRET